MVAVDAPDDRATLDLEVTMPAGWKAAGSGRQMAGAGRKGRTVYRWRQDRDVPTYTFGFVAGVFAEVDPGASSAWRCRYLGAAFSADDLRRIFRDTPGDDGLPRRARWRALSRRRVYAGARARQRRPGAGRALAHVGGLRTHRSSPTPRPRRSSPTSWRTSGGGISSPTATGRTSG